MKIEELQKNLAELKIPKRRYVINDSYPADTHVLQQNYNIWEYFYFDERGEKNDYKIFKTEEEACEYMLKIMNKLKKYYYKF